MEVVSYVIVFLLLVIVMAISFTVGFYAKGLFEKRDGLTVNENNKEFIEEMMKWRNYNG